MLTHRIPTTYNHVQDTAATTWTIVHNLASYPIVDAFTTFGGVLQRILPNAVTYVDMNTVALSFTSPRSGYATVV